MNARRSGRAPGQREDGLLGTLVTAWQRGYADTQAVVLKATSSASRVGVPLLSALPAARVHPVEPAGFFRRAVCPTGHGRIDPRRARAALGLGNRPPRGVGNAGRLAPGSRNAVEPAGE